MANNSPSLFAMEASFIFIQLTQNETRKEQRNNSLQYPDALPATSYWFSGALFIDSFSGEQTLCCLYSLQISTKSDLVSLKHTFICDEVKSQM